ncbi:helix-turn-helix transcriptional regulator [Verticiella sediminum]|uniref:Helix-turn-helix transcriptional regulator n=1 Tax=Verticiella sediminum TaxID=1247510 RepID=A0A556ACK2_9BURK|nr:helix-turn-helix domain-containing protein [Verticiella sediminum]TSH90615.1 helix-turn-helix transcriptional regulator [Verticiella sediminum]
MDTTLAASPGKAGDYLRLWRKRRRLSQLDLALAAEVSQRHLSFLESGRAAPSRQMLLRLAEQLDVPLQERNAMMLAAGYAPTYTEHTLEHPSMAPARDAIERVLKGHEPFPALAVDRHWQLLMANAALGALLDGVRDRGLLAPPVNVLRLSLHPDGLATRIDNLAEWRAHVLERLRHQIASTQDPALADLLRELAAYPVGGQPPSAHAVAPEGAGVFVPLRLKTPGGLLSFISTTTVFGTPRDVLLAGIAVEAFFPADARTRQALERLAPA